MWGGRGHAVNYYCESEPGLNGDRALVLELNGHDHRVHDDQEADGDLLGNYNETTLHMK